jgi:hypothetical protein
MQHFFLNTSRSSLHALYGNSTLTRQIKPSRLHFVQGTLYKDGTQFDSSIGRDVFDFNLGKGEVIKVS